MIDSRCPEHGSAPDCCAAREVKILSGEKGIYVRATATRVFLAIVPGVEVGLESNAAKHLSQALREAAARVDIAARADA